MALAFLSAPVIALALLLGGVGLAVWGLRALATRRSESALGILRAVDTEPSAPLRSDRYRIQGRPDAIRQLPDGRLVPIEVKSRASPANGPRRSHLVQVWAYCLLVEETTGRSPPFGVLRYADREYRVTWDPGVRHDLLSLRAELGRPYDGRATPSPARCVRCAWVDACDARVLHPSR